MWHRTELADRALTVLLADSMLQAQVPTCRVEGAHSGLHCDCAMCSLSIAQLNKHRGVLLPRKQKLIKTGPVMYRCTQCAPLMCLP